MRRDDAAGRGGSSAVWSRRQGEITFDRLDKVYCTTEFSKSELQVRFHAFALLQN
jgi:hypothetical protein